MLYGKQFSNVFFQNNFWMCLSTHVELHQLAVAIWKINFYYKRTIIFFFSFCDQGIIIQEFNLGVGSHIDSDVTFHFLIFLFIITETKIHSIFWEKYTVFQLLFHLVIIFHSRYFWKSWVLQLYFSVWHIESKTNLKAKKQQYSLWNESCCLGLNIQFPLS